MVVEGGIRSVGNGQFAQFVQLLEYVSQLDLGRVVEAEELFHLLGDDRLFLSILRLLRDGPRAADELFELLRENILRFEQSANVLVAHPGQTDAAQFHGSLLDRDER